jgi:hypothetical protein
MSLDKFGRFAPGAQAKPAPPAPPTLRKPGVTFGQATQRSPIAPASPPPRFRSAAAEEDITQTAAEWDAEMDTIDKQQEQLLNNQWTLLRKQLGSLMTGLAEVKAEVAELRSGHIELKGNVLTKEMESVIDNMVKKHDGHDANHSSFANRLDYLEQVLGESVDRHGDHEQHKASIETRVEYMEKLLGESADKHDDMAKHKASMEQRVEYMEGILGESADKHQEHAKHKASMEQRVNYVEKLLGESAEKHGEHAKHKATMEQRMEFLEALLGDNADRHMKGINDLNDILNGCAKADAHLGITNELEAKLRSLDQQHRASQESMVNMFNTTIKEHYAAICNREHDAREKMCRGLESRLSNLEVSNNIDPPKQSVFESITDMPPITTYGPTSFVTRQPSVQVLGTMTPTAPPPIISSIQTSPRLSQRGYTGFGTMASPMTITREPSSVVLGQPASATFMTSPMTVQRPSSPLRR